MIRSVKDSARVLIFIIGLLAAFGVELAFAQNKPPTAPPTSAQAAKAASSKRTSINFEDQLVEGQTQKPELFYLLQQRNNNFKRLIRLRENFLPEMRKTSEDIAGSGNKGSRN